MIFRELSPAEEQSFREYARENRPPNMASWDLYHPVCRQEWEKRGITPHDAKQLSLGEQDVTGGKP